VAGGEWQIGLAAAKLAAGCQVSMLTAAPV